MRYWGVRARSRLGRRAAGIVIAASCAACTRGSEPEPLFALVPPDSSGVTFVNALPEDTSFNILKYLYFYNGGGVAAGDVNGDGLPDLYFTSNLGPDRLYLNRGNYRFEDVTERAGVGSAPGWTSGVTMADANGDGHLDIHVSTVSHRELPGRNVLYLNRGDGTFTDETRRLGLEHSGYSTQAAFFDYDRDGDLDMYLLNSSVHEERGPSASPQRSPRHPRAGDRLFRNDGARFVDVSERAGIHGGVEGYGLGVVASDFDADGCMDLFVANDFQENDFLYRNRCDGTFTESIAGAMGHTSRFSMGADAADMDNDGRPDLVVLDMLPSREEILRTSATWEPPELFDMKLRAGYHPQYARNTLQLNRGGWRFSDIGYLAGVAQTDWSWSALFADLDNDGHKDLFVTNGIYRRPNDLDYIAYVGSPAVQAQLARGLTRATLLSLVQRMPSVPLPNHAFRNNGDLTFTDMAARWGVAQPGFSTGAVYVDLNNSGALDLVVNNVNAPASIYRNRARRLTGHHFLRVTLRGPAANPTGVGARVTIRTAAGPQMAEQVPTRGFQSAVDHRLHFGLGGATRVDSLVVVWPDGTRQALAGLGVDCEVTLSYADAMAPATVAPRSARGADSAGATASSAPRWFLAEPAALGIDFRHSENSFADWSREPFMPHLLSTEGPALAVGDVNGDSLDDVYVGGAKWQAGRVYLQRADGTFRAQAQPALGADSLAEDVDAALFDADGDGDLDLYVVSGGGEFWGASEALLDRLYRNDGRGNFTRDRAALPAMHENGSTVAAADFDADGRVDLFVGSRMVAREYGATPRSHLLRNVGGGRFADVTDSVAPALRSAGMVTSAAWVDHDRNGTLDLVVVGEWMPVRLFARPPGGRRFVERTRERGLHGTEGWWNRVAATDLNGDGWPDLVLGNLGLNSWIRASRDAPARMYVHDFGDNGIVEQILTVERGGARSPVAGRDELLRAIPELRARYPTYRAFGAARLEDLFPARELRAATVLEAGTMASSVALNDGAGRYALHQLPREAQFAPVRAILARDFDGDGRTDVLLGGNFFGVTPMRGRYDASYGTLLRGLGDGRLVPVDMEQTGVVIEGQVRALALARQAGGGRLVMVARNNGTMHILRAQDHPHPGAAR